jgi:hypothetical protein
MSPVLSCRGMRYPDASRPLLLVSGRGSSLEPPTRMPPLRPPRRPRRGSAMEGRPPSSAASIKKIANETKDLPEDARKDGLLRDRVELAAEVLEATVGEKVTDRDEGSLGCRPEALVHVRPCLSPSAIRHHELVSDGRFVDPRSE